MEETRASKKTLFTSKRTKKLQDKKNKLTDSQKIDILQKLDLSNKNNTEIIVKTVLEDFFLSMPKHRQKDYLSVLKNALHSENQDFSMVFMFSETLIGEEYLEKTREFIQITYITLLEIYQRKDKKVDILPEK